MNNVLVSSNSPGSGKTGPRCFCSNTRCKKQRDWCTGREDHVCQVFGVNTKYVMGAPLLTPRPIYILVRGLASRGTYDVSVHVPYV